MSPKNPIFAAAMDRNHLIAMFAVAAMLLPAVTSCRQEELIQKPSVTPVEPGGDDPSGPVSCLGFYLLNEGNMGSNKSTLDWYDATNGNYVRNIYGAINPDVPKELGDVGNDLQIYGSRLYAVINCSNKVEILDAATCRRLGQVNIPNCRYIAFDGPYAYVTSYAGPVRIDPEYKQIGYVAKIDTATMAVVDTVHVGFQPDGLAVAGRRLYVANSGGYMVPNYENTVSVIDIPSFKLEKNIEIAINLHNIIADSRGQLWISSRGDYYDDPSRLYCYDIAAGKVTVDLDIPVSDMWLDGDCLYVVATSWSYVTMSNETKYAVVDVVERTKVQDCFITDGTEKRIAVPYGVAVNPVTKEIYVTDARNYVNPGDIYCFTPEGKLKWTATTGDIPAHFAFRLK